MALQKLGHSTTTVNVAALLRVLQEPVETKPMRPQKPKSIDIDGGYFNQ